MRFGYQVSVNLAIDWDASSAEAFMRTHGLKDMWGPIQFTCEDPDDVHPCFVLADIFSPAWLHYTTCDTYDMMFMSPPCPPWSSVNAGKGSCRIEGKYMYAAWSVVGILRPQVVAMEMVSNLLSHPEWKEIRKFITAKGYIIQFCEAMDLADIIPQHRDRLVLIAIDEKCQFALNAHRCVKWPILDKPTLRTHQIISDEIMPWCAHVHVPDEIMKVYLDPEMLPSNLRAMTRDPKRLRKAIFDFRMKDLDAVFPCILTTYGHAHELDEKLLKSGGLFGTMLYTPEEARFLQIQEIMNLFAPTNSVWLPNHVQTATRILGNAISVPHAAIAISNCIAFLRDLTAVETSELFAKIVAHRLHAGNTKHAEIDGGHLFFRDEEYNIPATVPMHEFANVTISNGLESITVKAELGIKFHDIIRALFGRQQNLQISLQPMAQPNLKIPLPADSKIMHPKVRIFAQIPLRFNIDATMFRNQNATGPVTIVLASDGVFALERYSNMKVGDVNQLTSLLLMTTEDGIFTDSVGFSWAMDDNIPQATLQVKQGLTDGQISIFEHIHVEVNSDGIRFDASEEYVWNLRCFLQSTGLHEVIKAFGWFVVYPIPSTQSPDQHHLLMIPKPGRARLCIDDMRHMLALHLFMFQMNLATFTVQGSRVRCRFKMYGMWIWKGDLPMNGDLQAITRMWQTAARIMHAPESIRFICDGQMISPGSMLRTLVPQDDVSMPSLDFQLTHGQSGGGKIDLVPAAARRSTHEDANDRRPPSPVSVLTHDLTAMERNDHERTLVVLFDQWFRIPEQLRDFPISDFLEFECKQEDGFVVFDGPLKQLITFNKHLKHSGVELVVFQAGWIFALQFIEYGDPPQARLLCIPRPGQDGVTANLVRMLMQMCFASMSMPKTVTASENTCMIKIKLWGTIIFQGSLPRNTMASEIFDAYDKAAHVVNIEGRMRLIARGKMVIQEYPIRHYIHKDKDSPTLFSFVLQLRGGGGGSKPAPIWEAKHAIATAFVTVGADLKDIDEFTEKMVLTAGPNSILEQCKPASVTARVTNIKKLANQLKIPIPETNVNASKAQQKMKDRLQKLNLTWDAQELTRQLVVEEGFFCNQDDTPAQQLQMIQPNQSGFVLASPQDAEPWLGTPQTLSQDEFAIVVVGKCNCQDRTACKELTIPMFSSPDNPLIVKGTLHQLGGKDIKINSSKNTQVPVADTAILCVTAFRDEVGEQGWGQLIDAPIKFCMNQLQSGDKTIQMSASPWGRSFQKDKAKVQPDKAVSFQYHCRIPKSEVKAALRASGLAGIYTTVKSELKQVSQDYNVVWLTKSTVELQKLMVTHVEHRGIVRSSKSQATARGLRFESAAFVEAFKKLRPDEEPPESIRSKIFFKMTPTPPGATAGEIMQFLKTMSWRAKPIRALSGSTWLCASETQYPDSFLTWNNNTILIKWIPSRNAPNVVIVAGNPPKKPSRAKVSEAGDPMQIPSNDPWAAFRLQNGNMMTPSAAGGNASNNAGQFRKVDAPLENRFKQQDDALEHHKQQSAEKIAKLESDLANLQTVVTKSVEQIGANQAQTQKEFVSLRQETSKQFTDSDMHNAFQTSLNSSLASHEKHVSQQFDELKNLLMNPNIVPRKAQKTEHQADMEDDKNL
eukprot:Skav231452  [mRNA]  locus=scaffold1847:562743:567629:- [translate_table: standard]